MTRNDGLPRTNTGPYLPAHASHLLKGLQQERECIVSGHAISYRTRIEQSSSEIRAFQPCRYFIEILRLGRIPLPIKLYYEPKHIMRYGASVSHGTESVDATIFAY